MTRTYYRPLVQTDTARPAVALPVAGGWCWFSHAETVTRQGETRIVPLTELPPSVLRAISAPRMPVAGLTLDAPRIMGILNVTPDSFSDGGRFNAPEIAQARAAAMVDEGADILDIGGESTRPGADTVSEDEEIARTEPVIAAIRAAGSTPVSIDTRKAGVARAALGAGASLVNDVAAFTYDPALAAVTAEHGVPVCLMHALGDPKTMQKQPFYDNVLLDVYDFLEQRVEAAVQAGIPRGQIIVDPGIGFGKTLEHNLTLLRGIALFHALGCPILLGASRKRFIGTLSGAEAPEDRVSGSVAVALGAVLQGVQILRVHDITATKQALRLQDAVYFSRDSYR